MELRDDDFEARASGNNAVNNLTGLASERIREKEKTKRLLIIVDFLLVALALLILIFTPPEKETLGYIIGAALLILALGAIGARNFVFEMFGISVDTRNEQAVNNNQEQNENEGDSNNKQSIVGENNKQAGRDING
jgi:hypothetical protein